MINILIALILSVCGYLHAYFRSVHVSFLQLLSRFSFPIFFFFFFSNFNFYLRHTGLGTLGMVVGGGGGGIHFSQEWTSLLHGNTKKFFFTTNRLKLSTFYNMENLWLQLSPLLHRNTKVVNLSETLASSCKF